MGTTTSGHRSLSRRTAWFAVALTMLVVVAGGGRAVGVVRGTPMILTPSADAQCPFDTSPADTITDALPSTIRIEAQADATCVVSADIINGQSVTVEFRQFTVPFAGAGSGMPQRLVGATLDGQPLTLRSDAFEVGQPLNVDAVVDVGVDLAPNERVTLALTFTFATSADGICFDATATVPLIDDLVSVWLWPGTTRWSSIDAAPARLSIAGTRETECGG